MLLLACWPSGSVVCPSVRPSFHATFLQFSVLGSVLAPYGLTISSCKLCIISQDFSVCREIPWWQDLDSHHEDCLIRITSRIKKDYQTSSCDCELKQVSKPRDFRPSQINIHPNFPQLLKMVRFTYFESFLSFLIPNQLWIKHQNTKFQVISTPYKFWCKWIQNSTITIQIFLKNFNWHKVNS